MAVIYGFSYFFPFLTRTHQFFTRLACVIGALIVSIGLTDLQAQTYVFARLDGIPMNTTGWTMNGEAAVRNVLYNNNSELLLTSARLNSSGGIFFNQPINLSMCSRWRAEFDFRINGGTAADGIAFSFLDAPPSGFVIGEGLGLPAGVNGLKICFDTYNNCNSNSSSRVPKIEIRWGAGYNECWSQPTRENIGGILSFIRSNSYNRAVITYDNGNISVAVNGTTYITGFQQFNFSGYLGFTASTGAKTDNHSIRNAIIYTDMPPSEAGNSITAPCNTITGQIGTNPTAGYSYSWTPATGLSNPAIANPVVQLTNTTGSVVQQKYYVRTSFTSNPGCSSIDSMVVQLNPLPAVGLTLPVTSVCSNAVPFSLTGGTPAGGTYSGPGLSGATFTPSLAGAGTHTITYTFTDGSGCSNAATRTITVNALQQVLARNDVTICAGTIIPLTASNAVNYQWSPNTNLSSTSGSSVIATPVTTTTYTVQATDANNCASSDQVVVTVVPPATASISYPGSPYCGNQQIPVVLTGQTGGSYTAPAGLSIHPTNGTIQLAGSTPGTYTVTYTFGNGICTDFTQTSVTILPPPSVSFSGVLPGSCFEGAPFSLTGGSPAGGIYSGPGVSAGSFNPSIAGRGYHEITYSFTNAGGCVNSATNSITVYPIETVFVGPSVAVCSGGTIAISATRADAFTWSPATGLSTTTGAVVLASPLTTTMYTVTGYDNASGCTSAATITVSVLSAPTASIAYAGNPFCRQGSATVMQTGQTGGTYSAGIGLTIDPNNGTIDLGNSNPGTYTVTYSFSNGGCSSLTTATVTILPPPSVTFDPLSSVCLTSASFSLSGGNPLGGQYSGPGVNAGSFNPGVAGRGYHTIVYTVTDVGGCMAAASQTIFVSPLTPVEASADRTTCAGSTVALTAIGAFSYQWNPGSLGGAQVAVSPLTNTMYTVTATHDDGCTSQDQVVVLVRALPEATISYTGSPFCTAGTAIVNRIGQSGGTFSSNPGLSINSSTGDINLAGSTPGIYTVTYSFSDGICTGVTSTNIEIVAPPSVTLHLPAPTACLNALAFTLSGGMPGTGTYSGAGVSGNVFTPSAAGRGQQLITYTYTSAAGCTASATDIITVHPILDVNAGSDISVCAGNTVILSASNAVTYSWSPAYALSAITGNEVMASPLTTTLYKVTGTDAAGCVSEDDVWVTVLPLPAAVIQYPFTTYCTIGTTGVQTIGQTGGVYSADAGLAIDPVTGEVDLSSSTPGSYTVTYSFSNGSCINEATTEITILPPPAVSLVLPVSSACVNGLPVSLSGGMPAGGVYSGVGVSAGVFTPNVAGNGVHVITYVYTNVGGCSASATASFTVNPLVNVAAGADLTICLGSTATLTAINGLSYSWSPGSTLSTSTGSSVVASPLTTTSYTVTGMDANGCSSSDVVTVNVLPLPTASISYVGNPFCQSGRAQVNRAGQSGGTYSSAAGLIIDPVTGEVDLSSSTPGSYTVTYSFSNGSCINEATTEITILPPPAVSLVLPVSSACVNGLPVTLSGGMPAGGNYGGVGVSAGVFTPSVAGTGVHVITYVYTNAGGCSASATASFTVNPLVNVAAGADLTICLGSTATLTAINGLSYSWSPGSTLSTSTGSSVVASPLTTTSYTVTGMDANGCSSSDVVTVNVLPLPTASISYAGNPFCQSGRAQVNRAGQAGGTYSSTAGLIIDPVTGEVNLSSSTPGSYTVTYSYSNGSCINEATTEITILPPPAVSLVLPVSSACVNGLPVTLSGGMPAGGVYSGVGVSSGVFTPNVAGNGVHVITYVYTNAGGCSASATASFTVNPLVNVAAGADLTICLGSTATLTAINGLSYSWSPGSTLSTSTGSSVVASPLTTTSYTVTGMDANGCISSDVVTVQVLALPTASISYAGNPFCQSGRAQVNRAGQSGGTYSSAAGLIIDPVTGEVDLSSSTPGSYTVTYSFSNGSCTSQVKTEVSIFSLPIVVFQPTLPSVCVQGNPFTLTGGNPTGGVYRGRGVTGDVFSPGAAGIGLHVIEYTYTNAKGCASTAAASIQVVALVRGNTNLAFPELCVNATPFTLTLSNGVTAGGQFSGSGVVGDRFFPSLAGVGTHTIRYITPGVSGCAILYTGTIQVNPKPALQVTAAQQVCEGMPVVINAQATGDLFWSDSTSTSMQNFAGSLTFRATRTTTYLITCRDGKGCSNVQPVTIEVVGFPDANFRLDKQDFCNDGKAQVLVSGLSGGSFTTTSGLFMNRSTGEIDLSATQPGSYTITYQVSNRAGCVSSTSRSIVVKQRPELSLSNLILCVGTAQSITTTATLGGNSRWQSIQSDIVSVDAMGVVSGLRAGRTTVLFTNQAGCTTGLSVTVKDLPQVTGRNIVCKNDSIRLTAATAGGVAGQFSSLFHNIVSVNNNGWVKGLKSGAAVIRYRDVDGCVATYPLQVDEVQERIAGPIIGCEPGTVRLDRALQSVYGSSGFTFTFWRDPGQSALLSNPLRIATSGIYYAQVINGNGCKLERPVELRVTMAKALQPKRLDTVKTQYNAVVQLQARPNGVSYLWTPAEGLNAVNVPDPWFRYNKNMEYRVTMQTDSGCAVTDTVFVKALDANVFVPTAFTPNRDGLNDKLTPVCFSIQRLSYFTIFNRWGEIVFTTNAIGKGWDGTAKGSPADAGTYVWMLEAIGLDGQVFRQKGTVVLIR